MDQAFGMDLKDLLSSIFIRNADFDMNLQSSGSENCLIKQVFSISHANYDYIVQGLDTVQIGEKLIHYSIFWT